MGRIRKVKGASATCEPSAGGKVLKCGTRARCTRDERTENQLTGQEEPDASGLCLALPENPEWFGVISHVIHALC